MRKLLVLNHLTLDGVMQAPARPDEDPREGFQHGGWGLANADSVLLQFLTQPTPKGVLIATYRPVA